MGQYSRLAMQPSRISRTHRGGSIPFICSRHHMSFETDEKIFHTFFVTVKMKKVRWRRDRWRRDMKAQFLLIHLFALFEDFGASRKSRYEYLTVMAIRMTCIF